MSTALIMIGVGCIIGAIIGGGVKLVQVELGPVASLWRQMLLGGFGLILVAAGMVAGGDFPSASNGSADVSGDKSKVDDAPNSSVAIATTPPQKSQTIVPDQPGVSQPSSTTAPAAPPPVALPAKVDVFWCETGDGVALNEATAQKVATALGATGQIGRVRVRELSLSVNAQPDYQIHANIVRYDPGERPAAEAIAAMASRASAISFAPAHALPGTPSVDYLSTFVCAPS